MVSNRNEFVNTLRNVQVTTNNDSVWFLDAILDSWNYSPFANENQRKMYVGSKRAAYLLQAMAVAKNQERVLNGYDGSLGYFLWDKCARMWDKVDFDTYAQH